MGTASLLDPSFIRILTIYTWPTVNLDDEDNTTVPEVVRMARRVRARCPNDVRAREETTSGAVVVLAKGDVTDRTGDGGFKKRGKT